MAGCLRRYIGRLDLLGRTTGRPVNWYLRKNLPHNFGSLPEMDKHSICAKGKMLLLISVRGVQFAILVSVIWKVCSQSRKRRIVDLVGRSLPTSLEEVDVFLQHQLSILFGIKRWQQIITLSFPDIHLLIPQEKLRLDRSATVRN